MSKKRVLQKVAGSILLASVVVGGYMGKAYAEVPEVLSEENVVSAYNEEPGNHSRSAKYVWFYKVENGYKLMRLYDATNEKWLTPWLLCPQQ